MLRRQWRRTQLNLTSPSAGAQDLLWQLLSSYSLLVGGQDHLCQLLSRKLCSDKRHYHCELATENGGEIAFGKLVPTMRHRNIWKSTYNLRPISRHGFGEEIDYSRDGSGSYSSRLRRSIGGDFPETLNPLEPCWLVIFVKTFYCFRQHLNLSLASLLVILCFCFTGSIKISPLTICKSRAYLLVAQVPYQATYCP